MLLLLAAAIFALYAMTAQTVVGFEDSAGFSAACMNADIAHAPGYPLYSLLCHAFAVFPAQSPAHAASLFSAACGAAAVAVLARVVYLLTADAATAVGAAALYGVSRTFWSQATIPEVYALNVLLFCLALLLLLQWRRQPSVARFIAFVFVSALALTNHWPLFLLAAPAFLPLMWGQRGWLRRQLPRCLPLWLAALAIGLAPYAYLYWRANNPVAFLRLPAAPDGWLSLWQIVSREIISPAIDNPAGSGWQDKAGFAGFLAAQVAFKEIGLLGVALIPAGLALQRRQLGAAATAALCLLFAGATVLLVLLLNFLHDEASEEVFTPYPLLSYVAVCIWAALALRQVFGKWRAAALAALCLYAAATNYAFNDRSRETLAADIADAYLETLPPGAFFPLPPLHALLAYRQYTTGQRADVLLLPPPTPYSSHTITPGEKLYPPNTLPFGEEMAAVNAYAAANPLCYNTFIPFAVSQPSREYLLFSCLRGEDESAIGDSGRAVDFLRHLAEHYPQLDNWSARKLTARLITDAARTLMLLRQHRLLLPEWGALLEELSTTPAGQLGVMEYLVRQPQLALSLERARLFEHAAAINLPQLNRRQRARLLSALADSFAAVQPRSEESQAQARRYHRQAADTVPAAAAPAVQAAYRFYQREQLLEEALALRTRYGEALLTADTGIIEE